MHQIEARWSTSHTQSWMANAFRPRVLHVFKRACNLIDESGEILSLTNHEVPAGPFSVVVDGVEPGFTASTGITSAVTLYSGQIFLGGLRVDVRKAHLWNPKPDWERLRRNKDAVRSHLPLLSDWVRTSAPAGSLAKLLPLFTPGSKVFDPLENEPYATRFLHAAFEPVQTLCRGITTFNLEACRSAARRLAGLGGGLTPAGDDFLVGATYATWMTRPPELTLQIVGAMVEAAAPLTSQFSAAWLKAAGRGEASASWHTFLNHLAKGNPLEVLVAAECLVNTGHTSGADSLAGFLAVFKGRVGARKLC